MNRWTEAISTFASDLALWWRVRPRFFWRIDRVKEVYWTGRLQVAGGRTLRVVTDEEFARAILSRNNFAPASGGLRRADE